MTVPNGHVIARRRGEPQSQLPFKGESFPDYVVHRTPPSRLAKSAEHQPAHESDQVVAPQQPVQLHPANDCPPRASATETASPKTPSSTSSAACSPLVAPKPSMTQPSPLTRNFRTSQRPSLADQIKAISQGAQDVTTRLKTTYKLAGGAGSESALATRTLTASGVSGGGFQATTIRMTVGRLDCRFPCPTTFAHDHCAYLFQHPFEAKEIQIIMYYRDMVDVSVAPRDKTFRFRIDRALHQFGDDYNPSNPQHWIKIVFATASDADRVKQFLAQRRRSFTSGNS